MAKKESNFSTIEEMQKEKADWVAQTKRLNNFNGIKNTLTKLYTSSGHFIFELLQNAEDVHATSVSFKLYKEKLVFEHNGTRPFNINDIDSITNIGDSTKEDNGNTIGKFGIGFKSVFEYTASPEIHSENYHFKIIDLFIPEIIDSYKDYDSSKTVIILPFNGDKSSSTCFEEIKKSFSELKSTVLLFLQNIAEITCTFETTKIKITRTNSYKLDNCPENVCRIQRSVFEGNNNVKDIKPLFYKRFFKNIKVLNEENEEKQITIGIAFKVVNTTEDKKWKISPIFKKDSTIPGGRVFAYFPCKSEERKFCFHIHAPFALTVDREKLRENNESNAKVIEEIGSLICESMKELKEDGLVTLELYKTLPNQKDDNDLGKYEIISTKIINYFLNNPYVLMADGTYEEAQNKFIGFHNMQELLSNEDLAFLENSQQKNFWIKNPMQNKRDYNFLVSLNIKEYDVVDFLIKLINVRIKDEKAYFNLIKYFEDREISWFVRLYSLMNTYWTTIRNSNIEHYLPSLKLCYANDNKLYTFSECFLGSETKLDDISIHLVNTECFNQKYSDTDLKYFFRSKLGVKEFSFEDLVTNYCEAFDKQTEKTLEDTLRFFDFYKRDNSVLDILKTHRIICSENNKWAIPTAFYIPEELSDKVKYLSIYYDFLNSKTSSSLYKVNPDYRKLFSNERDFNAFYIFLDNLGCKDNFQIFKSSCKYNPQWRTINSNAESTYGGNRYVTDHDYSINYFKEFLRLPMNEALFELLISAFSDIYIGFRYCEYSPASKYTPKSYPSQISLELKDAKWFIQEEDGKAYFVKPEDAFLSKIPLKYKPLLEDYNLKQWLNIINFGKKEKQQSEELQKQTEILSSMGIDSDIIDLIQDIQNSGASKSILADCLNDLKDELQSRISEGFYSNGDFDEDRLSAKSAENYNSANDIDYEDRTRRVRIGDYQKTLAEPFLRENCIDEDGVIHCQICKNTMPFKNKNNLDYFEVVQLFSKDLIKKNVKENYVALCPICSAKVKVYYQHEKDKKKDLFDRIRHSQDNICKFKIMLDKEEEIMFSEKHICSLKAMIEESQKE